jgi:hypothetical protein
MTAKADMSRPSKRFVLPYESEYTAHRNDERASRMMWLRRKAREHVKGPAIMPDLADVDHLDAQQKRKRLRLES